MIVLYKGARGKGKTLTMVKDAYFLYKRGYKILSNMYLTFGESITNDFVVSLNKDSKVYNAVLVLDEVQVLFDSRNFKLDSHKKFSNFIQQIRKRNIVILCTAQYSNTIDLRLRQHIDVVVYPDYDKLRQICTASYIDVTSLEDDLLLMSGQEPSISRVVFNAVPIFKLYDTKQMIV